MRITHYNNSFFLVEGANSRLVCDPWIGPMKDTGTWSFPLTDHGISMLNELDPCYIYISHLHTDHFDDAMLGAYRDKTIPIIIKKFTDNRLYNKLAQLGFTNINQQKPWVPVVCGSFELTIVPSDSSTSDNTYTAIDYDLDTSLIIYDLENQTVFFNNVDNPLSNDGFAHVLEFINNRYRRGIDVAAVCPRAASEYPQCFLNIDRTAAKKKVIKKKLLLLSQALTILRQTYYIPAGGSYFIYGRYGYLDQYVAHPTNEEIESYLLALKERFLHEILFIEGCGSITIQQGHIEAATLAKQTPDRKSLVLSKSKLPYPHDQLTQSSIDIHTAIESARRNYYEKLRKIQPSETWEISFLCYENIELSPAGAPTLGTPNLEFTLQNPLHSKKESKAARLLIYIEQQLLYLLLNRTVNWNMAASGSLLLYKREPDIFIPDIPFSLNFLSS